MRKFGIWTIVILTALISSAVTSAFWLVAFNRGPVATAPEPRQTEAQTAPTKAELEIGPSGLAIPVAGIKPEALANTYKAARSGGRIHNAIDIMAPHGTPVVAADAGRILRLSTSALGGITIYATDPEERFVYYYAHLQGYREGLAAGTQVARGDTLGYVGSTGNASPSAPHLHFQVMRMPDDRRYWGGEPINPFPALAGSARRDATVTQAGSTRGQ